MTDTYNDHLITELKQYGSVKHRRFCLSGTTEETIGQGRGGRGQRATFRTEKDFCEPESKR